MSSIDQLISRRDLVSDLSSSLESTNVPSAVSVEKEHALQALHEIEEAINAEIGEKEGSSDE